MTTTQRALLCWWCDRPIAIDEPVLTDPLGRPFHIGACAGLSAEFDNDPDNERVAALIEQRGQPIGDEYASGLGVATVYTRVEAIVGYPAAIVWRRTDGGVDVERHETAVHALLDLEEHRQAGWEED